MKKEIVIEKCTECRFYTESKMSGAVCAATMLNLPRKGPQWPPENCPMRTAPIVLTMRLSRGLGPGA